jgi:hypothetical protein
MTAKPNPPPAAKSWAARVTAPNVNPQTAMAPMAPASPAPTRSWYGYSCRDGLRCELGHTYTGPEDVLPTSWRRLPSVPTRWICALGDTVSTMRRRTGVPMPTASKTSCARLVGTLGTSRETVTAGALQWHTPQERHGRAREPGLRTRGRRPPASLIPKFRSLQPGPST